MNRFICFLLFCFMCAGCKRQETSAQELTNWHCVRCVFIKNHTKQPLVFQVAINSAAPESLTLAADRGVFLYEPMPERVPYSTLPRTHISISSPDGSRFWGDVFAGELAAILTTTNKLTASGWVGGGSNYGLPTEEWLTESHLEARQVPNLRSVEVAFSENKP